MGYLNYAREVSATRHGLSGEKCLQSEAARYLGLRSKWGKWELQKSFRCAAVGVEASSPVQ